MQNESKGKGKLVPMHSTKVHREVDESAPRVLNLSVDEDKWSASRSGRFTPIRRALGTFTIENFVGLGACLDTMKERNICLTAIEFRFADDRIKYKNCGIRLAECIEFLSALFHLRACGTESERSSQVKMRSV
jgi:hypothetical protein